MVTSSNRPEATTNTQTQIDRGSNFASEMERDRAHREKARSAKPLRQLAPFIMRYPWLLVGFTVFLVLATGLTLLLPAAFRLVVDCGFAATGQNAVCEYFTVDNHLTGIFLSGICVAILLGVASALRFYFISRLGERVVADLRRAVYDHLLTLSPGFYANTRTGEVLSRLTTDTTLIQTVVGSSFSIAIRTIATTIGAIVLMLFVSWKLTLMVLAVGPFIIGPIMLFGRRVQRLSRSTQDSLAHASARASESLRAIETVQAFTREPQERENFGVAVEETFEIALQRIIVRSFMTAMITSFVLAGLIGVLWFGALQVQNNAISPGAMTQFVMYAFVAVSGVGMLTETYVEIMRAAGASERLMELLGAQSDIRVASKVSMLSAQNDLHGQNLGREITLSAVSFHYPSRPEINVLNEINLTVQAGQKVALVGPSGAGKSTVFQLLLRFYDPQSGEIKIDDAEIKSLAPADLRQCLSIVQQDAPLFGGSVEENIQFGNLNAGRDEIVRAARAANAHGFIEKLTEGYQTQLGEGGANLSGGQRQRLAIARAILKDAPILLLDEATSALDSESELAIQQAFETISKNRTTLVIAHRLSTVLKADLIAVFDEGRIVDHGTHHQLLERGGLYARLAKLQFGEKGDATK